MVGRIVFLSAAAFMAYRYIRRSNKKVQQLTEAQGTVAILPPEQPARVSSGSATETLPEARPARLLSTAAEDLTGR